MGPSRLLAAVLLTLSIAGGARAQPVFDAARVGPPGSGKDGELAMPAGQGPRPAVVVLHGCDGVDPHYRDWLQVLSSWGYAALLVDSFRPRGLGNICNRGRELLPPRQRVRDAFAAAEYLRTLPTVRPARMGLIGFSHGGWTTLHAVLTDGAAGKTPFAAAVAYYPGCERPDSALVTDTLILIGEADDWTPAARCQQWRDGVRTGGRTVQIKVYPGARHGFDSARPLHRYAGHLVGRDPAAARDAEALVRGFFDQRLGGR
jgi:dienelactone hydrolase